MGKSPDKKRKRDSDAAEDEAERPKKRPQTLNENAVAVAKPEIKKKISARKQIRSERKTKKALEAKQNALRKKMAQMENGEQNPNGASDGLAQGKDFVSLDDDPTVSSVPAIEHFQRKIEKAKKSSPRSIRKKEKAEKIARAAEEEGLVDPTSGANATNSNTAPRFICFVGNLPFTATTEQVSAHFAKLQPKAVRLSTHKETGVGKGYGFLEFDSYDKMKTCLKNYHHTIFDPARTEQLNGEVTQATGRHRKMRGRKLNIELTAGGGGQSSDRKSKIKEKNKKLGEERIKEKLKPRRERPQGGRNQKPAASGGNAEIVGGHRGDIHPSRMNMVST